MLAVVCRQTLSDDAAGAIEAAEPFVLAEGELVRGLTTRSPAVSRPLSMAARMAGKMSEQTIAFGPVSSAGVVAERPSRMPNVRSCRVEFQIGGRMRVSRVKPPSVSTARERRSDQLSLMESRDRGHVTCRAHICG